MKIKSVNNIINNGNELSCDSMNSLSRMMKLLLTVSLGLLLSGSAISGIITPADTITFYDGLSFTVIGRFHSEKTYARFPANYKDKLREPVWDLGQHSAGISIRFRSNSPFIAVRWSVKNDAVMDHMPFTGIKGVDLYSFVDGKWKYINTGRVKGKRNEFTLVRGAGDNYREYLLNLPLYDGADTVSIGVSSTASISVPQENYLIAKKPVVYYGSSIVQGGCASRPGMLFTNILARKMDRSFGT